MSVVNPPISPLLLDAVEGRAFLQPWTVEQYHWAVNNGMLASDPAYELLDGWIVRKDRSATGEDPMTIGDRHQLCVMRINRLGPNFEPHGCFLQCQQPVALPPLHEPEPDAAVIRGSFEGWKPPAPGSTVLCIIEVADASLRRDRTVKLDAYAAAAIPLYVIVNLVENQVELYTPQGTGGYGTPRMLKKGDSLHLPTATSATVPVAVEHLLP